MSFTEGLRRLVTGPAELFYGMIRTLFLRLSFSPAAATAATILLLCLAAAPVVISVLRRLGVGSRPKELNPRQKKTDRNNRILLVLCCVYLTILTGLLIPSQIIAASPQEFADVHEYADPARYLLKTFLTAAGAFALWGLGYGLLLLPKARKRYTLLITVFSAWAAINYMLFGKGYGIISSELRYEAFVNAGIGPALLNLAALAAATGLILLLRKKAPVILRIVSLYGCIALIVMTAINIHTIRTGVTAAEASAARQTGEKATFRLDLSGKNVVVIMMDRTISGFVPYFMEEKPELLRQFDGFTWYPNTLAYGYHTNIAAPALFGGYEYRPDGLRSMQDKTLREKHNEALKIMPVNFLNAGYEVTVCDAPYADYQWIPDMSIYDDYPAIRTFNTIGTYNDDKEQTLAELERVRNRNLFCYSLFRCAPVLLQETVYDRGMYLEADAGENGVEGFELLGVSADFMNSYMVMKNLSAMTQVTDSGGSTFLMLTNEMTHNVIELQEPDYEPAKRPDNAAWDAAHPIRRTADGKELDLAGADELVKIHYHSDMAAFIQLGKWFDELRAQGVWDNTRIILVSDHGCYLGLFGVNLLDKYPELKDSGLYEPDQWTDTMSYNPLLMVKDFGAKGFTTDNTFMTNADTPVTAFEGLVDDPRNPYTGNPVTGEGKNDPEQHLVESDWAISRNDGIFFTDPVRITFRGTDVFNLENWSVEK